MNVVTRGIKNAFRSPLRSGAIILMLAISIGLILCMLVAKSSIETKITEIKANAGTNVTISPAGINGFEGGGSLLTSAQVATIKNTEHVSSIISTLQDRLSTSNTNLTSSLELGNFGARMNQSGDSSSQPPTETSDSSSLISNSSTASDSSISKAARITVVGTTEPNSVSTNGSSLNITSGKTFSSDSGKLVALVGTDLANKNSLKVGSTFTMYSKTVTVVGIFKTSNAFQDSELIMPIATVQSLTNQTGEVSSITATVDSSSNVSSTVTKLKSELGSKADVTSEIEQANSTASSLSAVSSIAVAGVIGATVAGAVIVLLSMVMIVRERSREIGVIKAIGGSDSKVIAQFVTEAISLTIAGAILGMTIGVFASAPLTNSLVSSSSNSTSTSSSTAPSRPTAGGNPGGMMRNFNKSVTQVSSTLTPTAFVAAAGITFLIAVLGSAIPAWFIAKIRPSEVLRTE